MEARRYYPLLDGQEYDLMVGVFVPIPNINCLDCRFDLQEAIDEAKLLEAICLTGKRLPYLRVRLHEQEDGSVVQYIGEDEPETVNTYDVNESEVENVLLQWRDEAFDNNGYDVQLYCFRVIRKENGLHTLYLKISHFIMDGYAIMYTVRYLMRVYSALMNHTALPEEEPLPWKLLDEEKAYRGSAREEKDARWWRAQFKTEPCFTSVNGKGSPEFVEGKRYGREPTLEQYKAATLNLLFPKEFVTKVSEFAAERHISQQVFYMLAIRSFLGRVSETEDVSVISLLARRSTKLQRSSGLSLARAFPTRTCIPEEESFGNALQLVAEQENELYRHSKFNIDLIKEECYAAFEKPLGYCYESVAFTYQPYFDMEKSEVEFKAWFLGNGFVPGGLYLMIQPEDTSGNLCGSYTYAMGYTHRENVERLHAFILKFLDKGIAAPEKPLAELIEASL